MRDLGLFPGATHADAYAINDRGQVAGIAETNDRERGFFWDGSEMRALGTLGGRWSRAYAINAAGHVAGASATDPGEGWNHAFVWDGAYMRDLGTLPDGRLSWANGLNDYEQVVGWATLGPTDSETRAFLWENGAMRELPHLPGALSTEAHDINNCKQIVGVSAGHAALFQDGGIEDLNDFVLPGSGWHLRTAWAINDAGVIVGAAVNEAGTERAFILTPDGPAGCMGSRGSIAAPQTYGSPCENPRYWHVPRVMAACEAMAADPVNLATGAFVSFATDAALPSPGVSFRFDRSYTSLATQRGELGVGWVDSLSDRLTATVGSVTYEAGTGQQIVYTARDDGSFASPPPITSTLNEVSGGYELTTAEQVRYRFDEHGRLTEIKDRNGQGLSLTYGADGLRDTIRDSAGRVVRLEHDGAGLLTRLLLPDGRAVEYAYTDSRLTAVSDLRGGTTRYAYDADGRLVTITDPNGHVTVTNAYGPDGRILSQRDALGQETSFDWDQAGQTASTTDARGNVWRDRFEGNVLVESEDPLGNIVRYSYHPQTLDLRAYTDAVGNRIELSYDARHNLIERRLPAPVSYVERFAYNERNDPLFAMDGRGNETSFSYDAAGNLERITRPLSTVTTFERDARGLATEVTDPRGKAGTLAYDGEGNLVGVTSPRGARMSFEYDAGGQLKSAVEPRGNEPGADSDAYRSHYAYDDGGNLIGLTDPLGNETRWVYDAAGNLASVADANGHVRRFAYDAVNRLVAVTAPDGSSTRYAYDGVGNLIRRTDANDRVTRYEYDSANRLVAVVSPLERRWEFAYDGNGNRTRTITPSGETIRYVYDTVGRLISIDYSDETPDVMFGYDANGNRVEMLDGGGRVSYRYDALDRLTETTRGGDSFAYAYDQTGNLVERSYPGGARTTYAYDDDGSLVSVTDDGGNLVSVTNAAETTNYHYDSAGRLVQALLPNGVVEERSYDRAGRLLETRADKGADAITRSAYVYDAVGNPVELTSLAGTERYRYDALDRLVEFCLQASCAGPSDPFTRYSYDAVGNRILETTANGQTTYVYNADDELISSAGPTGPMTFAYDANGNQTRAGPWIYDYDLSNRLVSARRDLWTATFAYDGDGTRLSRTVGIGTPTQTTRFLWDVSSTLPQLAMERSASGLAHRRYILGADRLGVEAKGITDGVRGLPVQTWEKRAFYHGDRLGSIVALTSTSGATLARHTYEPFGTERTESDQDGAEEKLSRVLDFSAVAAQPFRFAGEYRDAASGLDDLRARQYHPEAGRFTALDPLPRLSSAPYVSSYVYAENRPTVLVDPSGLGAVHANQCGSVVCWLGEDAGWGALGVFLDASGGLRRAVATFDDQLPPWIRAVPSAGVRLLRYGSITYIVGDTFYGAFSNRQAGDSWFVAFGRAAIENGFGVAGATVAPLGCVVLIETGPGAIACGLAAGATGGYVGHRFGQYLSERTFGPSGR